MKTEKRPLKFFSPFLSLRSFNSNIISAKYGNKNINKMKLIYEFTTNYNPQTKKITVKINNSELIYMFYF